MSARFGRVVTAMITAFTTEGELDIAESVRLAKWLQDQGNEGLVIAGTTGEASTLTDPERLALFEAVVGAVTIPVIAGTGSNDTAHSVHLTKEATKLGVAGILAVGPYYNRPSQAGIAAHIKAMAGATTLPVVVYDIPVRTGRKISTANLVTMARDVKNIVGLKDAGGNPGETANVIAQAPSDFEVYSGDDGLTLPLLAVGAVGVIGVATHWSAPEHRRMMDAFFSGNFVEAQRVNAALLESYAFETGEEAPNPLPSKEMMKLHGFAVGDARLPMGAAPEWVAERARVVKANIESFRSR
ncbi:MAG: 4-hydroxy-tetrahydrodipicolinate synthase [Ilumatobacteraceae bacterium]|nr:4-hydroxy-tetrahydrodipicolinate synthase [Ilumatobacteraceae bacterium]MBU6241510.1 4-hydroxy-tetrahydrodipicolinate synthase [Acidobacteriota bacterium]